MKLLPSCFPAPIGLITLLLDVKFSRERRTQLETTNRKLETLQFLLRSVGWAAFLTVRLLGGVWRYLVQSDSKRAAAVKPRVAWRRVEQQSGQLPVRDPQRQPTREPQQQHWFSCGEHFVAGPEPVTPEPAGSRQGIPPGVRQVQSSGRRPVSGAGMPPGQISKELGGAGRPSGSNVRPSSGC